MSQEHLYSVSDIIYYGRGQGTAGVIIKDEINAKEIAMTHEEAKNLYDKYGFDNAYVRNSYRKDYDKYVISIQPKVKNSYDVFADRIVKASEFYANPFCEITTVLQEKLDKFFTTPKKPKAKRKAQKSVTRAEYDQIIKDYFENSMTLVKIAEKYGISKSGVFNIVHGRRVRIV